MINHPLYSPVSIPNGAGKASSVRPHTIDTALRVLAIVLVGHGGEFEYALASWTGECFSSSKT